MSLNTQKISILEQKISHDFYQEHIKTRLNNILHPSDQLNCLVSMLELSDQDREYRSKLVNIIQNIAIQEFGSAAKVFLFGSTSRAGSSGTFSGQLTCLSSEVSHLNIFLHHFFLSDQYFFIIFLMRFHFLDLTFKTFKFFTTIFIVFCSQI